jgi:hypothetical protein
MAKCKKVMTINNWQENSIDYKFNSKGFRSIEFENEPNSILWLGCSHTLGIGLPEHMTFAARVCSHFNLKNFNLGLGGAANQTCFRVGYYHIPIIQPRYIVYVSPEVCRIEIKPKETHMGYVQLNPTSALERRGEAETIWKHFIRNETNMFLQHEQILLALQQVATQNNAKFLYYDSIYFHTYIQENPKRYKYDRARDCMHAGPRRHEDFATMIINDIEKLDQKH